VSKVLISDALASQGIEVLDQAPGIEVLDRPGIAPGELLEAIREVEGLIVRSGTKVTRSMIAAAPKLRVIGRAGIGVDNVDVSAATERGIAVLNTPEGNNITTAEHAISLLLSLARHIPAATASLKAGSWEKKKFTGMEIYNRTLGVVGLGNIGRIVALRAQGLGMKVVAYDPHISREVAVRLGVELTDFDELLSRADAISVHVPRNKDTEGLLGAEAFARAKRGVLIVNAARGGIVDEAALLEALESGQVGGAALDVFSEEPPPAQSPLIAHERVICTPHLGASTEQAQVNVAVAVAEQVRDYLLHGLVQNAVNVPSLPAEILEEVRPYLVLAEKLGRFQGQLATGRIDEVNVEYAGVVAELDVAPITIAVLKGLLEPASDRVNMVNAPLIAQERGIKVIESKASRPTDFASGITVRLRGSEERLIAGAVFHGGQPRIVRIDGFMLEAIPEGPTLFLQNQDEPGVVGTVGRLLGEGGINISRMQLALSRENGEAAMLINVDASPDEGLMTRLREIPQMLAAKLLEL